MPHVNIPKQADANKMVETRTFEIHCAYGHSVAYNCIDESTGKNGE